MKMSNYFLMSLLCLYIFVKPYTATAMPGAIRFSLAGIQGATAAACLLTAATCLRSCLETKAKSTPLKVDSYSFEVQPSIFSQLKFTCKAMVNNAVQTACRNIELIALKATTLSAAAISGFLGLYLTACCIHTLNR